MKKLLACLLALLAAPAFAQKVNQLPPVPSVLATDLTIDDQANNTYVATMAQVANFVLGNLSGTAITNLWAGPCSSSLFLRGDLLCVAPSFSLITGNIATTQMNSGTSASSTTFWRGDGTWATPAGSGTVTTSGSPTSGKIAKFSGATAITNAASSDIIANWSGSCSSSTFLRGDGACATPAGSGTVTNTGGSLTANDIVLGAGSSDTKVVAGIVTDGTSKITLGVSGTSVGGLVLNNATTGAVTLQPVTGALGTVTASLPANTGTVDELNLAATYTAAKTFTNSDLLLLGSSTGANTFTAANSSATNYTTTVPANTGTLAETNFAQTFLAVQTFTNSDLCLLGSSTGCTTFTSANSGASNFTATVPANSGTLAEINLAQTFSAAQTFSNSNLLLLGSGSGATTFTSANSSATNYTVTLPAASGTVAYNTTGSFTGTLTGMTGTVTGTINYSIAGNIVTLTQLSGGITGTSNTTALTITGAPSAVQPAHEHDLPCGDLVNFGTFGLWGQCSVASSGTITLSLYSFITVNSATVEQGGGAATFANSSTKGISPGWTITYSLD